MDLCTIQKVGSLHNFFPEKFELQLYQAFRKLKALGCDYFYFLGSDDVATYRFCTHDEWIDFYRDEQFILNDPLKRIIEDAKFLLLPWSQLTYLHSDEKRTMYGRVSFGLFNGLTITREFNSRKYTFALATECKEHDLARYLILEKINTLEELICDCIKLFDQYLALIFKPTAHVMM
ncbi:hypothetical protein DGG96_16980 [Legionella qingyii]|uniref:Transcription factor LuxR-like autoinducer-binding domain-containing protein n=1 Tax=Legionella qingyii TaxID=2184757 RepID=A0A317U1T9_9GAMM|nr:autoinducer binding domain-containing protein [Legionella qingyii]PWY54120.1 hypothetical protein DGG96_18610 [Legionella qingyii]PWY54462.1 hypothetical protein DGG96_16980 [Legionella qingyii]RUR21104.1 hypothetical protein ELY20_13405 [Legionella qingyii]HDP0036250.1 autoinducer binding domain-containing protein [Legionella pneumophila]